jgi:hypothetical protein
VREACEREGLADLEDLRAVDLVLKEWIARRVGRRAIRRRERLRDQLILRAHHRCPQRPTSAGMSSSKCRVSPGLRSSGRYGA